MALVKANVMKVSTAYFFFAAGKTIADPPPIADLLDFEKIEAQGYTHIGHTSIEQVVEVESDGGGVEVDGSLQVPDLFTNESAGTRSYILKVWEWNTANLKLALGSNAIVRADGSIGKHRFPIPTTGSLLIVVSTPFGPVYRHLPMADAMGTGDFGAIGGRNSYADMPIRFTAKAAPNQQSDEFILPMDKMPKGS